MTLGEAAASEDYGFPWGSNKPTRRQRFVVAGLLGAFAALIQYYRTPGTEHVFSDFTPLWHAARVLAEGGNPYSLIGPNKTIESATALVYPAPAFVSVLPLMVFDPRSAAAMFVFLSTALLAWGVTKSGWHLLPIFPSVAFVTSARLGQWSILMTAALFLPSLAFFGSAKPQASLAVIASSPKRGALASAVIGTAMLVGISLLMLPSWPMDWWATVSSSQYFVPPVARVGGPVILLALLRWRRSETWLVVISALSPQTWYPYNSLVLFTVARTYHEACFLSLFSSVCWMVVMWFLPGIPRAPETQALWGAVLVATGYLPAILLILRRPNEGPSPWWFGQTRTRMSIRGMVGG